jgi:hypothetical protein
MQFALSGVPPGPPGGEVWHPRCTIWRAWEASYQVQRVTTGVGMAAQLDFFFQRRL